MKNKIKIILEELEIPGKDFSVYQQAFTHPSYVNENRKNLKDYQRLEFVGDAVLQLVISNYIFARHENLGEGDMSLMRSNLVRMESLAALAKKLNLGKYMFLGHGEEKSGGRKRDNLLADTFESLMAAIYLDLGFDFANDYIVKIFDEFVHERGLEKHVESKLKDSKTKLQELVQADTRKSVTYVKVREEGPANQPTFEYQAMLDGMVLGVGVGTSKKAAEQAAASDALSKMATIKGGK